MIQPWAQRSIEFGMTYGISVAGYDVRVEFDAEGKTPCKLIEAGEFVLASTIERFQMPIDVIGFVHDKSSWARQGLTVQNTVIEPGWSGFLTLELTNHSRHQIMLKRGMPIAQIVFHFTDHPTTGYLGKYNEQERGPQRAR